MTSAHRANPIPNILTGLRLAAGVVMFAMMAGAAPGALEAWLSPETQGRFSVWAFWIFVIAASTDWVDGYLARRYDIVSDFGKLWDPIADKLLTGAGFIGLAILGEISWWIVAIILVREWGITIHRLIVVNDHVVAAAWMGKLKTAVQGIALAWALLPLHVFIGLVPWMVVTVVLMLIVLVLTVASGIDYIVSQSRGSAAR